MVKVRLGTARAMTPVTTAQELCPLFKALADPRRLEVVLALAAGERCVCELTEQMGVAQSKLSFHLKVCLLYTSPSPRDRQKSRMPSSA